MADLLDQFLLVKLSVFGHFVKFGSNVTMLRFMKHGDHVSEVPAGICLRK